MPSYSASSGPLAPMLSNATSLANTWALGAATAVLIAYPIARIVIPAILQGIVPDVERTVLNLM